MSVFLRSFYLETFDNRVLYKVCLPSSLVLGYARLMEEERPMTGEKLVSGVMNRQLAGIEELHPHLSG